MMGAKVVFTGFRLAATILGVELLVDDMLAQAIASPLHLGD
jgi:hypothetical protein